MSVENKFESSVLGTGMLFQRGYTSIINNAGKSAAIITLLVAVLVTFTEIGFQSSVTKELTATMVIMLIASYTMYFSTESAGERLGRESEEYVTAYEKYREVSDKIAPEAVYRLREFCKDYSREELKFRRSGKLMSHGLSKEEYERYLSGERVPLSQKRIFLAVRRMKPAELTPGILLYPEKRHGGELKNPERSKHINMLIKLLPSTLCTLFTVSVMLGARDNLDAIAVIEGLVRLSALPLIALRGYCAGYAYAKDELSLWLKTKTKLLSTFLKSEN